MVPFRTLLAFFSTNRVAEPTYGAVFAVRATSRADVGALIAPIAFRRGRTTAGVLSRWAIFTRAHTGLFLVITLGATFAASLPRVTRYFTGLARFTRCAAAVTILTSFAVTAARILNIRCRVTAAPRYI